MEILACPIDKHHPLELYVFEEREEVDREGKPYKEIVYGVLYCPKCGRYYPIDDEIPIMLPDELRDKKEDLNFLRKWKDKMPEKIWRDGKPFNLSKEA